jgi:hypothetical protein
MGAEPYFYCVPYQDDIDVALQELRQREFQAGRYNPVMPFLPFPVGPNAPAPGAQHATIAEALEDSDADGTRSILDLDHVADEPDFGAVVPLDEDVLEELYGTTQPTHAMIESNMDFFLKTSTVGTESTSSCTSMDDLTRSSSQVIPAIRWQSLARTARLTPAGSSQWY